MKINNLLVKPLSKLPECLIYRTQKNVGQNRIYQIAKIISLKDGKLKGVAEFYPANAYRGNANEKESSVFVSWLYVYDQGNGFGTKLLNYVKEYSKKIGCHGNFWLDSSPNITPQKAPHTFYRKYGMTSDSLKTDKQLDKFIKQNKIPTYKDMGEILRYYPPIAVPQKENIFKRIYKKLFFK